MTKQTKSKAAEMGVKSWSSLGAVAAGTVLFVVLAILNESKSITETRSAVSVRQTQQENTTAPAAAAATGTLETAIAAAESVRGGVCESWPMSNRSLPLGASLSLFSNGFAKSCNGLYSTRTRTFGLSFDEHTSVLIRPKTISATSGHPPIDCSKVALPTTMMAFNKVNDKVPAYDQIRKCFGKTGKPFISFRGAPKLGFGPSEIGSKDGISILTKKYAPCNEITNPGSCILPETFRISDSQEDCKRFFETVRHEQSNQTVVPRQWVRKPVHGFGGNGVNRLSDPLKQLKQYETTCEKDGLRRRLPEIVVQQYMRPKLIQDGRSFHMRVYFLYKFGRDLSELSSSSSNQASSVALDDDPPQAWHIKIGNVHLCSEPYSMIDDPEMGKFAVKCNGMAWKENPRIEREGGWMKFNFTQPYPSFLEESFSKEDYALVMERIDGLLKTLAKVVRGTAEQETKTFATEREGMWLVLGNDIMIDDNLRPWLIEVNACPGNVEYGPANVRKHASNLKRNPHIAAYRIAMSHYKRYLVGDGYYNENACGADDELGSYVTRVM